MLIDAIAKPDAQIAFMMPERLAKTDPYKAITEIVGSGPFRFVKDEFVAGSSAAWEKFDGYMPRQEAPDWTTGGKIANFQRIEWKIIPDAATASAALQSGEIDWYEQVQADLVPLLRRNGDIAFGPSNPQGYIGGLRFNHLHPPFNDVRLRRAMLTAVNQEDYMGAITGNDPTLVAVCRSQFPCGTTYGTEVDLPVQKGDLEPAKAMIKEAGYSGQKAVIINPTDFATIGPLGDITYDMFKKIGINAELAATDWGTVVQRRSSKEPVEKGGWSVFPHLVHRRLHHQPGGQRAVPRPGRRRLVRLVRQSQDRADDSGMAGCERPGRAQEDRRCDPAGELCQVPTVTLGQFQIPTAYRKSLQGRLACNGAAFWNVKRA